MAKMDDKIVGFCQRLEGLEAGDRARLKRCAGKTMAESRGVLGLLYRLLPPGVPSYQAETYFLVATLYPLAEGGAAGDLGESLRLARQEKTAKGLDRRVEVLLDSDETQLAFRLRQAIHFLASSPSRVRVNWPLLLQHLLSWNHPKRFVQDRWARSYFAGPTK